MFQGFVIQEQTIYLVLLSEDAAGKPVNADALPTFRVYGPSGYLISGTAAFLDSAAITGATTASPIVITSAAHGLTTGAIVTVAGVLGNTAANGTFSITKVSGDTFSLDGSTGAGSYTAATGTWNLAGAYRLTVPCLGSNGFVAGQNYEVVSNYAIAAALKADVESFAVV